MPLLVYLVAAIVTTWPLVLHPEGLLAAPVGPGDPYLNLWILGWGMQAVLGDPASIVNGRVFDANIFHPATGTLAYSDHLLLQSIVLAPLYAATGNVVLCYNVLLIASLIASALAMHLFVRSVVGTTGGAYLAGLAWGFGSYRFAHLLHLQLQSLYFLPLVLLFLHRLVAGRRYRDAVGLGVMTGLQALSSIYYAVIGGVGLLAAALPLALTAGGPGRARVACRFVLAVVIGIALMAPVALVYWRVQQNEGFGRNIYEASRNAAYMDSYLQAPAGNVLYGRTDLLRIAEDRDRSDPPHTGAERELFPGFVLIVLAIAGAWLGWRSDGRPLVAALVAMTVTGFVLSLGPDGVRWLYAALHRYVFGFQAIRAPARFCVLAIFGLSGLAAFGWRELSARSHRASCRPRSLATAILVCAMLEWIHVPPGLTAAPPLHTDVGGWLRREQGPGAVAVLPIGIDIESTPAMVQSLEHRRPLVNGYSGQRPPFYAPLVETLSTFPSDESLLALHESDVRFVVTRDPVPASAEASPLVERARFAEEGIIYELRWTPEMEQRLILTTSVIPEPPGPVPFRAGEISRYSVGWNGAGMNLAAGEISVRVETPPHRLVVLAETAPWMTRFYEAKDRFVTVTDAQLLPLVHEREQNEGSRHVTRAFLFDSAAGVVRLGRSVEEARAENAITLPLVSQARDAIAALFYARTLALETGRHYRFPVNEAGRSVRVELTVAEPETITVQNRPEKAVRLEPRLYEQIDRKPVTARLWLSTDERRVPLALEIDAGFGRVRAELIGYQPGG
jgi:Protein of unknown function (DUF3108)